MKAKEALDVVRTAGKNWVDDKATRLGAAIAYYTVFAIPPLLLIVIFIVSLAFDEQRVRGELSTQLSGVMGEKGAETIQTALNAVGNHEKGIIATAIAVFALLLTSTGLFLELQSALNSIWGVEQKPGLGAMGFIKNRFLSFSMVIAIGFLLMVSLIVSTVLAAMEDYMRNGSVPGLATIWTIANFLVSMGVVTLLFAFIYKFLPDLKIAWSDVWVGAVITALLFTIGKSALGLYLAKNSMASAYGAAGSLVLVLLWVYYSAQILFFGAEITQAYANRYGTKLLPKAHAQWVQAPPEVVKSQAGRKASRRGERTSTRPPDPRTHEGRKALLVEELRAEIDTLRTAVEHKYPALQ